MEETVKSKDGTNRHLRKWAATSEDPKGVIFIVHGYLEHSGRYDRQAKLFLDAGFLVYACDHVGHGKSEGHRALVRNFETYVDDLVEHVQKIKADHPGKPVFAFAHSMGGGLAVKAALEKPDLFTGMVLIGPLIKFGKTQDTAVNRLATKVIGRLLPRLPTAPLDKDNLTHDTPWRDDVGADPLCFQGRAKAGWVFAAMKFFDALQPRLKELEMPFLCLHGAEDKIVDPECARVLEAECSSQDKTVQIIEGCYHQVHNESAEYREPAMGTVLAWLNQRC